MKTEQYINDFVNREKQTEMNPFLSTRVMVEIEKREQPEKRTISIWQIVVVAASLVAVMFLGINIGNSYVENSQPKTALNINDSQLENLVYYSFEEYE